MSIEDYTVSEAALDRAVWPTHIGSVLPRFFAYVEDHAVDCAHASDAEEGENG